MVNPFNRNFFRLLLGFTLILSFSFSLLFFINKYNTDLNEQELTIVKNAETLSE